MWLFTGNIGCQPKKYIRKVANRRFEIIQSLQTQIWKDGKQNAKTEVCSIPCGSISVCVKYVFYTKATYVAEISLGNIAFKNKAWSIILLAFCYSSTATDPGELSTSQVISISGKTERKK